MTLRKRTFPLAAMLGCLFGSVVLAQEPERDREGDPSAPVVELSLHRAHAQPGGIARVRMQVDSNVPVSFLAWSIEFDPEVLQFVSAELSQPLVNLRERAESPEDFRFEPLFDNEEGWAQFFLAVDFQGRPDHSIPRGVLRNAVTLFFQLADDAPFGEHALRFSHPETADYDGYFVDGDDAVYNSARPAGTAFTEESAFVDDLEPGLEDGIVLAIVGDVGFFLRGDANLDEALDISDAMTILSSLFLGSSPLLCEEVADANFDESVDLSDPVAILDFLFQGGRSEPLSVWNSGSTAEDEDVITAEVGVECPLPGASDAE